MGWYALSSAHRPIVEIEAITDRLRKVRGGDKAGGVSGG